jgi:rhodanese-related sulfurtransferase
MTGPATRAETGGKLWWLPGAATALAFVSCYGTALLIGLLSIFGVFVTIDQRAWAGAISAFAALAVVFIAASGRRRRIAGPVVVAGIGLAFILWAMYGAESRAVELAGFASLVAATLWDLKSRRSRRMESDVSWIEAPELARRLEREPRPLIIDVRGPDEFTGELGHLTGARNIPVAELPEKIGDLDRFKTGQVVLVCRTQMRSAKAAAMLREAGFRDVAVLRGGMLEWARWKRPGEVGAERR